MGIYNFLKPLLFSMGPEKAHSVAMNGLKIMHATPGISGLIGSISNDPCFDRPVELFGLKFMNPIGLAAGFDKDAKYVDPLSELGFGFIEIGTLTPKEQSGNPKPRLFRIPGDKALINRMGFNNDGVDPAAKRLAKRKTDLIIGGNIGKNKVTENEKAMQDYLICFERLYSQVDYFTINVSSPNTPGLRELQERPFLTQLFTELERRNEERKPILLKIAPDLEDPQLDDIIDLCLELNVSGIIATNTTIRRNLASIDQKEIEKIGNGGLSGVPVMDLSTGVLEKISKRSQERLPIIASGGIFGPDDVKRKMDAGAKLVQVYTGFIYEGPYFVKKLLKSL